MLKILLPADFLEEHRQIVLEYIRRGHEFKREDWRLAIVAFDLLKDAVVLAPTGLLPFPVVYRQQVEDRYADAFIQRLYEATQIEKVSRKPLASVNSQPCGPMLLGESLLTWLKLVCTDVTYQPRDC